VFEQFFASGTLLPITDAVVSQAIALRQRYRLHLGDALIAATAVVHNKTLLTHNVADFNRIEGLSVLDPTA
jgi:predicted nucleic acid-binding protein